MEAQAQKMKTEKINGITIGRPFPIKKVARSNKMLSYMATRHPEIKTAHDALEPMQITVSPSDVKNGVKMNHTKCAMALASCKALKADDAYIGINMACLKFGTKLVRCRIPESVSREIVCFDRHHDFDPDKTYRLSAIPPNRQLGRSDPKPKTNGQRHPRRRTGGFLSSRRTAHARKSAAKD